MPLDKDGREVLDQTPIVIRVRQRTISQFEDVRAFIRREMSDAAARAGQETFEESLDFEVDDDPDPKGRWEYSADQEAEDRETIIKEAERQAAKQEKAMEAALAARAVRKRKQPKEPAREQDGDFDDGGEED